MVLEAGAQTHLDDLAVEAAERVEADAAVANYWGLSEQPAGDTQGDAADQADADINADDGDGDDGFVGEPDEELGSIVDQLAAERGEGEGEGEPADAEDGTEAQPDQPVVDRAPMTAKQRETYRKALVERDMPAFHALPAWLRREVRGDWQAQDARVATPAPQVMAGPPAELVQTVDAIVAAAAAGDVWTRTELQDANPDAAETFLQFRRYLAEHADVFPPETTYSEAIQIWRQYEQSTQINAMRMAVDPESVFNRYQQQAEWSALSDAQKDQLDPTHARYAEMSREEAAIAMAELWGDFKGTVSKRARAKGSVDELRGLQTRADRVQAAANGAAPRAPNGTPMAPRTYDTLRDTFLRNKDHPDPAVRNKARADFEQASLRRWA